MKIWRKFTLAREFARSMKLKSQAEWNALKNKPEDIPASPSQVYKDGWISWGDWLGTNYVSNQSRDYMQFEEARKFTRSLKLKNRNEWIKYTRSGKKPDNIPAAPRCVYAKSGWISWGDWLGTDNSNKTLHPRSFNETREFVRSLGLSSRDEYRALWQAKKLPKDIPCCPDEVYKKEWKGWSDFLNKYLDFKSARQYIHALKLKGSEEYRDYCNSGKKPKNIPSCPDQFYSEEWLGWGDWVGTGRIANQYRIHRPYPEARQFVHSLKIKGQKQWNEYSKSGMKPDDIPAYPNEVYSEEWVSWGDWLGTGYVAHVNRIYRTFEEAREFVRGLKLVGLEEYKLYCRSGNKPSDIPNRPDHVYADKWFNWTDFLGSKWQSQKQRLMYKCLCQIYYPNADENELRQLVKYNYYHPDLRFKRTNAKMQLDVWIPSLNLAFEYQGEQHYGRRKDLEGLFEKIVESDIEKQEACKNEGVNLVLIDYLWDGTKEMLEKYIKKEIKPLVVKVGVGKNSVITNQKLREMGAKLSCKVWSIEYAS